MTVVINNKNFRLMLMYIKFYMYNNCYNNCYKILDV